MKFHYLRYSLGILGEAHVRYLKLQTLMGLYISAVLIMLVPNCGTYWPKLISIFQIFIRLKLG